MASYPRYLYGGVILARTTTDAGGLELPGDACLTDCGDIDPGAGLAWLGRAWRDPGAEPALSFASPELARQVSRLLADGEDADPRKVTHSVLATAAYLLRWRGRATPFGLFAGIASAEPGAGAAIRIGYRTHLPYPSPRTVQPGHVAAAAAARCRLAVATCQPRTPVTGSAGTSSQTILAGQEKFAKSPWCVTVGWRPGAVPGRGPG